MPRHASPLPAALVRAAQRFDEWRSRRTTRSIPAELWDLAAGLASRYGVSRTARALRVQYYDLRKRVAAPAPVAAGPRTDFVEIVTAAPPVPSEVVVEIDHASGSRMRVRLPRADATVLGELSRAFLGVGSRS